MWLVALVGCVDVDFLAPVGRIKVVPDEWTTVGSEVTSVAVVGDVDGDGYQDLLVGNGEDGDESSGVAYLFHGPLWRDHRERDADARIQGAGVFRGFGEVVVGAGDVNEDGYADLFIGSKGTYEPENQGAWLFLGPIAGKLSMLDADAHFLSSVEDEPFGLEIGAGADLTGDSIPDLLVAAPTSPVTPSTTYLFSGRSRGARSAADAEAVFRHPQGVGSTLETGDWDGDGIAELALSGPSIDPGGRVYILQGPLSGEVNLEATARFAYQGADFHDCAGGGRNAGDVDGDGTDDLLIGNFCHEVTVGRTFLLLAPLTGELQDAAAWFHHEDDGFFPYGWYHRSGGDIDGDGFADVLIEKGGISGEGVYDELQIHYGSLEGQVEPDAVIYQDRMDMGKGVFVGGDLNGDGYAEVLFRGGDGPDRPLFVLPGGPRM